jgi:hypothetical protein
MKQTPWTPELQGRLMADWAAGYTAAEIGERLGVGKNAVIGRRRRTALPSRPSPIKGGPVVKPKRKPAPIALPVSAKLHPPLPPHPTPSVHWRPVVKSPLPIPRGAIGPARTCQWTDCARAPWLFCDAPSTAGYSWCAAHKALVFKADA